MDIQKLKEKVIKAIDENKDSIIKAGREIYATPEFGYKEFKSTAITSNFLKGLGLNVQEKFLL